MLLFRALLFISGKEELLNLVKLLSGGLTKAGSRGLVYLGCISCPARKLDSESFGAEMGGLSDSRKVLEERGLKIVAAERGLGQLLFRLSKTLSNSFT